MALIHNSLCRLSLSNVFLPSKCFYYNRISTCVPLSKVSVEEKLGIKPRPKRPKSSFLRFISQIKPQVLKDNPNVTLTELNKIAGERWKLTDEKTKESLSQEYRADWNKYLEEIKVYERNLSSAEKEEIQKANETISRMKKKKKLKAKLEVMGKPKRPPSTFVSFMLSKIHERGDTPFKEWQQKLKKEWESVATSVKDKLSDTYNKDMEHYKSEMEKWERKMKREGHQDLVRRSP